MRDVEALSAAGVPVYTVRGPRGGIALLPGYRTNVTGLTTDESRALFVLLSDRAHTELGLGQALGSALRKLMAALPAPHRPDRSDTRTARPRRGPDAVLLRLGGHAVTGDPRTARRRARRADRVGGASLYATKGASLRPASGKVSHGAPERPHYLPILWA